MWWVWVAALAASPTGNAAAAQTTAGWMDWGQFSRRYELPRRDGADDVRVFSAFELPSKARIWIVRRETFGPNQATRVRYADSRSCPTLLPQLHALGRLQMPVIDAPQLPRTSPTPPTSLMVDGIKYSIEVPALFDTWSGRVRMSSNMNTPLARWVEEAFASWDDCWRGEMPRLN